MVFGEAVVACDMPEPCKFSSLDSYQKRFLWTHKEVDLAPHLVIGLVFHVGHAEIFPHALGFESLESFFESISNQCPCFTAIEEDEGNKRLTGTCLRSLIVSEYSCTGEEKNPRRFGKKG